MTDWYDDEEPREIAVFRGGKVHVLARQCRTCIFKLPEQGAAVRPDRTAEMLAYCQRENRIVPCHEWMDTPTPVVCRELYQTNTVGLLRMAERLGVLVLDDLGDGPNFREGQ